MDQILSKAGSQIITFAVRSGVSIASGYVIKSIAKVMEAVPEKDKKKLEKLKDKLQTRVEIVTYAIELIQLVAARGNTGLESTIRLTSDLKSEIDDFNDSVDDLVGVNVKMGADTVKHLQEYMQELLTRIEQTIPIINLALTTSGANLSTGLSNKVSPGRLLQASNIVVDSNKLYNEAVKDSKVAKVQVGPSFNLTMYDIFHNPAKGANDITWRERLARCELKIIRRVDEKYEYKYDLIIKEDFNDGRYHDSSEEKEQHIEYDLSSFQRLFFSGSGRLLKLNDRSSPVLVLKINKNYGKIPKDSSIDSGENPQSYGWIALGDYEGPEDGDDDEDEDEDDEAEEGDDGDENAANDVTHDETNILVASQDIHESKGSLSILEYLVRLCVLQSNDQMSVLEVKDERLNLYLNDENNERNNNGNARDTEESADDSEKEIGGITKGIRKLNVTSDK